MRPDWHQLFLKIAYEVAERSTCQRVKVGAIITRENRIISMGYNGVPAGKTHCVDHFQKLYKEIYYKKYPTYQDFTASQAFKDEHKEFSARHEIHGEMNAILFAARNGVSLEGANLYLTMTPCVPCAKNILQSGITSVYYHKKYDRGEEGKDFLMENVIPCVQLDIPEL